MDVNLDMDVDIGCYFCFTSPGFFFGGGRNHPPENNRGGGGG